MKLREIQIEMLENRGFRRWTTYDGAIDRLYINAADLGLRCEYHKPGSISHAEYRGETISHSEAYRMKMTKAYIDVNTVHVVCDNTAMYNDILYICNQIGITAQEV